MLHAWLDKFKQKKLWKMKHPWSLIVSEEGLAGMQEANGTV
jgi:hypothetical protein